MADRLTGKASYFVFNGVNIYITKLALKGDRVNADSTDSGDYDSTADMIYPTQIPVSAQVTANIEGRFRKSSIPTAVWYQLFTSLTNIPCVFGADLQTLFGHGNFDINNFEIDDPYNDIVTYTAEIVSNGKFTPNA